MKNKHIIAAASFYNKKCFFDETCNGIPSNVKAELIALCKSSAEMIQGIFDVSYTDAGNIVFTASGGENDFDFDEIGARLITDKLVKENEGIIKALQLWHALYKTAQGQQLKGKLLGFFQN